MFINKPTKTRVRKYFYRRIWFCNSNYERPYLFKFFPFVNSWFWILKSIYYIPSVSFWVSFLPQYGIKIEIYIPRRTSNQEICFVKHVLHVYINRNFLRLTLVFSISIVSSKNETKKMQNGKQENCVRILLLTGCTHYKHTIRFASILFWIFGNPYKTFFFLHILCYKCILKFNNQQQSELGKHNLTRNVQQPWSQMATKCQNLYKVLNHLKV